MNKVFKILALAIVICTSQQLKAMKSDLHPKVIAGIQSDFRKCLERCQDPKNIEQDSNCTQTCTSKQTNAAQLAAEYPLLSRMYYSFVATAASMSANFANKSKKIKEPDTIAKEAAAPSEERAKEIAQVEAELAACFKRCDERGDHPAWQYCKDDCYWYLGNRFELAMETKFAGSHPITNSEFLKDVGQK